ncbi:acetyl-CoA carboxylase biotin carboxylase subunit [Nocardia sp. NBC_00508]|uniref:acetyl-CoA carboxylase biotin carboxylase subunit n=1 Tax=Nocardia sp. NBC_00508 TaxID=2975992 RepID=UPI002E81465E|nr:acetyl-CoA carboxylase biotin carboxylase subunit [Nocardia sp. NBC_00508]WUD64575.1 acetyl-CoA carboxylase biotin carboxylase subunit [Nocardia sp. NBC_00508]
MFEKILIANRGEIALRVARTCRELGIRTVAVHSVADADSAVVHFADEAVQIGPPAAKRSYLNAAAVLAAAELTGADAIHPGYGFLSESSDFADACRAAGVTLIGPPADVMAQLGDKQSARTLMAKAGLPLLPGSLDPLELDEAHALADSIGFPVIIKAAAGGGGRGMQVVHDSAAFPQAYQETRATARMLFGDSRVYLEKYLAAARHVEIQVLCDGHGNGVHLGERDCSVQRRHQKLIEESPAPLLPEGLAGRMGKSAVDGVLEVGYVGAGTVEFLVDLHGNYYFMEVNCRIQVEHPVTEMVTGIDLIAEQIRIAAGQPLGINQEDIVLRGAAIECRINAEDPSYEFAPAPGVLAEFTPPGGPFVRVDTHAHAGYSIPPHYDSLLAKLVVWAPDRDRALARMRRALEEFRISGARVATTRDFLREVLDHPAMRAATHTTALVDELLGRT